MKCLVCDQERPILEYERDDPVLECGHLQAGDPDQLMAEKAVYMTEVEVVQVIKDKGLSRDEALDLLIKEGLACMSKRTLVSLLRVLSDAGISCEITEEARKTLSSSSQRYIKRD